uniref:Aminodeoxychorismate lyase n=1 Tax=Candidozyma auris TaxID=498019 RepID=A0A0L0NVC8_CANAR
MSHFEKVIFELEARMSKDEDAYQKYIDLLSFDPYRLEVETFQILSTIRYDPSLTSSIPQSVDEVLKFNFFLFKEHIARLRFTADYFTSALKHEKLVDDLFPYEITEKHILDQLKNALFESQVELYLPLKVRLLLKLDGELKIELHETSLRPDLYDGLENDFPEEDQFDIYVYDTPILPSPFTSFKTTKREAYNDARSKALPGIRPGKEEVILFNAINEVMEGSITNVAFRNDQGMWITPQLTTGCLCGVTRNHLLQKNLIREGDITRSALTLGQEVLLFNGIMGISRGIIKGFIV